MVSFVLQILLLVIVLAYVFKLFATDRRKTAAPEGGTGRKRFKTEGVVIKDADFSEVKDPPDKKNNA